MMVHSSLPLSRTSSKHDNHSRLVKPCLSKMGIPALTGTATPVARPSFRVTVLRAIRSLAHTTLARSFTLSPLGSKPELPRSRRDRPRRSTGAFARLSYRRFRQETYQLGWSRRSCPPFLLAYPVTPTGILSAHGGLPRRCIVRTSHDVRSGRSVTTATPVAGRQSGTPQPCGTPTGVLLGPGRSVGRPVHSGCCPFRCPLY